MNHVTETSKVIRNPQLLASEMDGEIVMMSVDQGKYFSIGRSGVEIWKLLEQEMAVTEIVAALREKYAVDEATCQHDVIQFIELMAKKEIVRVK